MTGYFERLLAPPGGRAGADQSSRRESTASQQSVSEAESGGQSKHISVSTILFPNHLAQN